MASLTQVKEVLSDAFFYFLILTYSFFYPVLFSTYPPA